MRNVLKALIVPAALMSMVACAQQVGDINRVQPNYIAKADVASGEWFIRQTVSDVPATTDTFFVGYTFDTERVRWVIEEDYLVAYRSYERVPGLSDRAEIDETGDTVPTDAVTDGRDPDLYRDQPVAAYPIVSHFDIQRQYNSSTGEQSNVISENTSDRPWYDRDYIRVDWSRNVVASFTFLNAAVNSSPVQFYVQENEGGTDALRMEYDGDNQLVYMDWVERHFMEPSYMACVYSLNGLSAGDCVGQEVEVRTSVLRAPDVSEYEPAAYDDPAMDRFGYFRTERLTYDRQRGTTLEGRLLLANRHNIWTNTWERDGAGEVVREADGDPIARPFAERTPSPVVYHLSPNFPESLYDDAAEMAAGWDHALRRAVSAAQFAGDDSRGEEIRPMFVLCNNPVTDSPIYPEGAAGAAIASDCGAPGTEVRVGDLRYNVAWWVNNPQQAGPLGYGPSAPDPETGEILSGTAYVYGASIDTYAQASVDLIRFANGDLPESVIATGDYVRDQVRAGMNATIDPRAATLASNPHLAHLGLQEDIADLMPEVARDRVMRLREDVAEDGRPDALAGRPGWELRRIEAIRESGIDMMAMNDEQLQAFGLNMDAQISDAELEQARVTTWMTQHSPILQREREQVLGRECIMQGEMIDDSIVGMARAYAGRTDYDVIYEEIRGIIFRAVMEHEVGHTLGLRHNFAGSWDSLNYFDEYYDAKLQGYPSLDDSGELVDRPFGRPETLADQFGISAQTEAQLDARMREYQYSSIMDYSSSFNTDIAGIGRYDEAAIMFAYTTGADRFQDNPDSRNFNQQEMGYVEVWEDLPTEAKNILQGFEDVRGIGYYQPLELYHYSTIYDAMGAGDPTSVPDVIADRSLVRLGDLESMIADGDADRPVEVPYMFCSDEYRSTRQFCRTWDRGADPLEQTLDYIERYRGYYVFDYYRRDRANWSSSAPGSRALDRYFFPLVDGYQRWLLTVAIQGGRPDVVLDNIWTFASYAGLNLLGEVVTTPYQGSYVMNEDAGVYELTSYDEVPEADIYVPEGVGRDRWSDYDASLGYMYPYYPTRAGHFWTQLAAMIALSSAEARVSGVEVTQFDTTYVIPPYLVFETELTRLFNSVAIGDNRGIAPLVVNTPQGLAFENRPLLTVGLNDGSLMNPESGRIVPEGTAMTRNASVELDGLPVDMRLGFSEQVYAMIYSMSSFRSNYSTRFIDQSRIIEIVAGDIPTLAPGYELIEFCDPTPGGIGICYGAYISQEEGAEVSLAEDFVRRGQALEARYLDAVENGTSRTVDSIASEIDQFVNDMNVVRSVYTAFAGSVLF
jgi:hypothetical protein